MNTVIADNKESQRHLGFIHLIAQGSGVPDEEVEQIYNAELEKLKEGARLSTFLPVLAGSRTKEILLGMQRGSLRNLL